MKKGISVNQYNVWPVYYFSFHSFHFTSVIDKNNLDLFHPHLFILLRPFNRITSFLILVKLLNYVQFEKE